MKLRDVELPDNRKFGIFIAIVCGGLATWLSVAGKPNGALALGTATLAFGLLAGLRPELLEPINKAWMMLGLALGAVVSPILLAILFFGLFTPLALMGRLAGRDELRLRRAPSGASYWRLREPPGPEPASFSRQF